MDEYIEKNKAIKELYEVYDYEFPTASGGFDEYARMIVPNTIKNMPAANVAPVRHGRWAHLGGDEWCCTNCGEVIHTEGSWEKPDKKFCYECGAKMDLED